MITINNCERCKSTDNLERGASQDGAIWIYCKECGKSSLTSLYLLNAIEYWNLMNVLKEDKKL